MTKGHLTEALWRHRWAMGLAISMTIGALLRVIWLRDMEYKGDEAWTFANVKVFWEAHHLPAIGMRSSAGLPNAGLSLWIFIALSSVVPHDDPLMLARAVQAVNITAILLLTVFILKAVDSVEREAWLWSVAFVSVNPLAVLFSRKIWPPDILPLFTAGIIICWWFRQRWWGAFFWGMLGILLGQIQLVGFLFWLAFAGSTLLFDRGTVQWRAWSLGTIVGVIPMIPWLLALIGNSHLPIVGKTAFLQPTFIQHWIALSSGADLYYSLGNSFSNFLAYPVVGGVKLYIGAQLLAAIVLLFSLILVRVAIRIWGQPQLALELFLGVRTDTALILFAAFWAYGLALSVIPRPIYLHYFVISFSLPMLWLARLELIPPMFRSESNDLGRVLLGLLVIAQAGLTYCFLNFIHETRFIKGDYGTVYSAQPHSIR